MSKEILSEIDQLSRSIYGLIGSFKELKAPLTDSRKKVPQATDQLDKISEQTEAATTQMLDTLEKVLKRQDRVVDCLSQIVTLADQVKNTDISGLAQKGLDNAKLNLNDSYSLMDSLQFQDITSQQMDHAASILEDIEVKLHDILSSIGLDDTGIENDQIGKRKERAFDPHADMFDKKTNQTDIDSMFGVKK